jgi:hypothetical protein
MSRIAYNELRCFWCIETEGKTKTRVCSHSWRIDVSIRALLLLSELVTEYGHTDCSSRLAAIQLQYNSSWLASDRLTSFTEYSMQYTFGISCVSHHNHFQWGPTLIRTPLTWGLLAKRVRFEVFTAVTMKNGVFWDVTPCDSCKNRRFGGT